MEHGSIERQIHVGASPEVVYDVVSDPGHVARWWSDAADFEPAPGRSGVLAWHAKAHTLLTVTEEDIREQGWEAAALDEYYVSHEDGWTRRLAELADYAAELVARR
jgi:hypothetical protein